AAVIKDLKQRLYKDRNDHDLKGFATTLAIITTDEKMAKQAINTLIELVYFCEKHDNVLIYPEDFEEIVIGNLNLNIGQIVVERLTNLLATIEYRHLPTEWGRNFHKIPWYENDSNVPGHIQSYAFTRYQYIRVCAAISLFKIQPEHKAAVRTLVELVAINPNEYPFMKYDDADLIRRVAADKIEKYGIDNQTLINTLSEWIATIEDQDALWWLANLLGKVAAGTNYETAIIIALSSKLQTTSESNREIAEALGKIKPANQDSIKALTKLISFPIHNSDEGSILCEVIKTIGLLAPNHPEAIKSLIKLQQFAQARLINCLREFDINQENAGDSLSQMLGEYRKRFGYKSVITEEIRESAKIHSLFVDCIKIFGEISSEESEVINILTELLAHPEEKIRFEAALSLAKVDPGNSKALNALIGIHRTTPKEHLLVEADLGFQKLLPNQVLETTDYQRRQTLINAITEIMETHPNPHQRYHTAKALAEVDPGNDKVVATLLNLLGNFSEVSQKDIINLLKETLRGNQLQQVVSNFKDALEEAYKNDNDDNKLFQAYYELFWHCAENLSYPEFYRAFLQESDFYHLRPPMLAGRAIALTVEALANISRYVFLYQKSPHYLIFDIVLLAGKTLKRLLYLSAFSIFLIIWPPLFVIYSVVGGIFNRKLWSN
ncbi:MAG: hypothetical protein HGA42_20150, partial [Nostocales cyanobacterium W4_Combined_metabat2_030]|nr:hypothetical protein [Nostocales cyanobacterium W4_Combined_metabat2_030]